MRLLLTLVFLVPLIGLNAYPVRSAVGYKHISMADGGGEVSYSAKDYVQDGLMCMWDGIENVGWELHEDNPTYWIDLVGEDSIKDYGNSSSPAYSTWFGPDSLQGKPYYNSNGSSRFYSALVGGDRTLEIVFTKTHDGNCVGFHEFAVGNWMNVAGFVGTRLLVYHQGNGFYVDPPSSSAPFTMTLSLVVRGGICYAYVNGKHVVTSNPGSMSAPANRRLFFGMNLPMANDSSYFAIRTHSIRIYDRALYGEDVLSNSVIDKARFNVP